MIRLLKQDIKEYEDGLEEIMRIRPVWYRHNGKFGLPTEERQVGVIAQEIQEVAPYTVTPYIETDEEPGQKDLHLQTMALANAALYPNYPNPFSESTIIRYYLPKGSANGEVRIMNLEGQLIKSVPIQGSGKGQLTLEGQALSPGTYLYSLIVNGELIATEKMVLIEKQ